MASYRVHKQGFLQLAPLTPSKKQGQRKVSKIWRVLPIALARRVALRIYERPVSIAVE